MSEWSPLRDDVLLKGSLTVFVTDQAGRACVGRQVEIRSCGFR